MALELPVVCGRSSFKPEVGPSGFFIFIELKLVNLLQADKIFSKNTVVKNTIQESASDGTGFNANQILWKKLVKNIWMESKELKKIKWKF